MPIGANDTDTLTTREVAAIFRVSTSTIINWADEGKIPYVRTLGRHRRFNRAAIEAIHAATIAEAAS